MTKVLDDSRIKELAVNKCEKEQANTKSSGNESNISNEIIEKKK